MRSASPTRESRRSTSATRACATRAIFSASTIWKISNCINSRSRDVPELGRSFDLVVCTGVLHHLPDPDQGLRALRDVLRPDGAMRLMVYARYGRAGIYMMQEYCRLLEIGPSASDLRSLAATLDALPKDHPIANVLRRANDFRRPGSDGGCAASSAGSRLYRPGNVRVARSVRHVVRSLGRAGALSAAMRRPGEKSARRAARRRCPPGRSTPPSSFSAERWSRTISSPTATIAPTKASRSPSPATSWRDYIPIALPWTICVRERLPPGSVAVLINQSHTFTDLILTVDSFEDRLLGAIDGKRTLAEIMRVAVQGGEGERRALNFFERLWRYDQIVFDASRSRNPSEP